MGDTLKPCPFCGSTNQMVLPPTCDHNTPYDPNDRAFPIVRCFGCITDVSGKDFDASGKTAIEAWNRRSSLPTKADDTDTRGSASPCPLSRGPADQIISQIETLFPDWRSYRDLVDCIECTLHRLKDDSHVR